MARPLKWRPVRDPRPAWRVRLGAVLGICGELMGRVDAHLAAVLDTVPLQRRALQVAAWLGQTWRHHRDAARRRAYGPAYGTAVLVLRRDDPRHPVNREGEKEGVAGE